MLVADEDRGQLRCGNTALPEVIFKRGSVQPGVEGELDLARFEQDGIAGATARQRADPYSCIRRLLRFHHPKIVQMFVFVKAAPH